MTYSSYCDRCGKGLHCTPSRFLRNYCIKCSQYRETLCTICMKNKHTNFSSKCRPCGAKKSDSVCVSCGVRCSYDVHKGACNDCFERDFLGFT